MKIFKTLNKSIYIFFWIIVIFLITTLTYVINSKDNLTVEDRRALKKILKQSTLKQSILNDYNQVFLPKTQFIDLDYNNHKIDPIEASYCYVGNCYTFFIDRHEDNLFILERNGNIFYTNINKFLNGEKDFKKISSNLDLDFILDLYINENSIYVSGNKKYENNNYKISIFKGSLDNLGKIDFKEIFSKKDKKCILNSLHSGKIQHLNRDKNDGLLFTTMSVPNVNNPDLEIQSDTTICGKILLINEETSEFKNYAKGFRNIIGLYSEENLILATGNRPMGGDEINKILPGLNYGWPIASYGDVYGRKKNGEKVYYKKNHEKNGYKEPIFAFVPSIGISEITKLSNSFSDFWEDNFLVGSLNKKTLYRIKFDRNFEKILFFEEIFIGDRIRDILYLEKEKTILLSLELSGEILSIKKK